MTATVPQENSVKHADEASFTRLVLDSKLPVLVDFYADWCGPCRMLAPVLEQLAAEVPNATIVKVNVDQSPRLASQYGVNAVPTLIVIRDRKPVAQHVGLATRAQLKAMLTR